MSKLENTMDCTLHATALHYDCHTKTKTTQQNELQTSNDTNPIQPPTRQTNKQNERTNNRGQQDAPVAGKGKRPPVRFRPNETRQGDDHSGHSGKNPEGIAHGCGPRASAPPHRKVVVHRKRQGQGQDRTRAAKVLPGFSPTTTPTTTAPFTGNGKNTANAKTRSDLFGIVGIVATHRTAIDARQQRWRWRWWWRWWWHAGNHR